MLAKSVWLDLEYWWNIDLDSENGDEIWKTPLQYSETRFDKNVFSPQICKNVIFNV